MPLKEIRSGSLCVANDIWVHTNIKYTAKEANKTNELRAVGCVLQ